MPHDLLVRPATAGDAEAIATIHVSAWHHAYAGLIDAALLAQRSVANSAHFWQTLLSRPDGNVNVLVTAVENHLTGFGSAGPQRSPDLCDAGYSGEITALYVDPDRTRNGIGGAILSALLTTLRDAGHDRAALRVLADNQSGRNFYEKSGGTLLPHGRRVEALNGIREVAYGWRLI